MAEADDYESLPDSTPFPIVATAGALAGVAEHCAMYPVDSVKTRMQSLACDKMQTQAGIVQMMKIMVKEEGWYRPMRGVSAMMMGAGPAHAMYFGVLETGKNMSEKAKIPVHIGDGVSAIFATCLHDAVMTPAEVVKQRMQMCCSPFTSSTSCTSHVFRSEGLKAFYRSYPTALTMNIPYQIAMVVTYGAAQRHLNPNKEYNKYVHFMAGGIAGAVASIITMPWDVCKTLLNTQEKGALEKMNKNEVRGIVNATRVVYRLAGITGFYKGLTARILYQFPATGISWLVYETFKHYLPLLGFGGSSNSQENDKYETLSSSKTAVMSQNFQPVQIGSRVSHLSSGGNTNTGSSAAVEDPASSRHSFKVVTPTVVAAS